MYIPTFFLSWKFKGRARSELGLLFSSVVNVTLYGCGGNLQCHVQAASIFYKCIFSPSQYFPFAQMRTVLGRGVSEWVLGMG